MRLNRICTLALATCVIVAGTGCTAQKKPLLASYSESLYACRKNPTQEMHEKHRQTLEGVVHEAGERHEAVPPGVYAELGYIHLKAGNNEEAKKYFKAESDLYPEAKVFTKRLADMAEDSPSPEKKAAEEGDTVPVAPASPKADGAAAAVSQQAAAKGGAHE